MNATINLREYLGKNKTFIIPNYQRGYVWGKNKTGNADDSVTYMLKSLTDGYATNNEVFIQGVTVSESETQITLIDGQQRTTFFYLLLKWLGYEGTFNIRYDIREESNEFLSKDNLIDDISENAAEPFQDIFFFKKTLRIISEKLDSTEGFDKEAFRDFVLDHVNFLYIDIPEDKATKVFSMMNGNKAEMKSEELIKAELLRLASLNSSDFDAMKENERNAIEWDNNLLRSRYAREWDKWLQWWNREDVKRFYKVNNVMGLLISTFQKLSGKELSFSNFKNIFLHSQTPIEAKRTFDGLRRLQKRFEDAFNSPTIYNNIGAILRITDKDSFVTFAKWYFGGSGRANEKSAVQPNELLGPKPGDDELDRYYKWAFLGLKHKEIIEKDMDAFEEKYSARYDELDDNDLYINNPEVAFRLLLRLNIDEDNKQEEGKGRKFDFSIWDRNDSRGRSLEHIFPKSKVLHKEKREGGRRVTVNGNGDTVQDITTGKQQYLARCCCRDFVGEERITASEHSIGNLVLLYKDDNSSFRDSTFSEKKALFFKIPKEGDCDNKKIKEIFKSRHLLHTIYKFASAEWKGSDIARNKYQTLKDFEKYYGK